MSQLRVLIIDGDARDVAHLKVALRGRRFVIRVVDSVQSSPAAIERWRPDLMLVGSEVLDQAQSLFHTPSQGIIAMVPRKAGKQRLEAFATIGVDEVVDATDDDEGELIARIEAVASHASARSRARIAVAGVQVDLMNGHVRVNGSAARLTPVDRRLLYLLLSHAGSVLSREQIIAEVWEPGFVAGSNVVDRHMDTLRRALRDNGSSHVIEAILGVGYRFVIAQPVAES